MPKLNTGIGAYTLLNIDENIHQFLSSTKRDAHRTKHWFLFSASRCIVTVGLSGNVVEIQAADISGIVILNRNTHTFNGPLSGTTQVSRYQKSKTNLDFTEARDSEWQWHQLGHMQVCTSLQTDNPASTSPLSFLQAGCPSCRPTNSIKALKAPPYKFVLKITMIMCASWW